MTNINSEMSFQKFAENVNQFLYVRDARQGKFLYVNPAYETIWQRSCDSLYEQPTSFIETVHPDDRARVVAAIERQKRGEETSEEYRIVLPDGTLRWIFERAFPLKNAVGEVERFSGIAEDISAQKNIEARLHEQSESLKNVVNVGQSLIAELDLSRLVQIVIDTARELCDAQFGAFFYNVLDQQGERYTLYALSGAPREAFANYPTPRATDLFGPTFRGEGTVRIDDVRKDPRYGKNDPYFGMPPGHLPVVSYLAVPVISRSGEVLGGLFYGHEKPGVFTQEKTRLVEHLAAQAAVAIDNVRLFEMVQHEQTIARGNEQNYKFLAESIPQIVWVADANGVISYINRRWHDFTGQEPAIGPEWNWQNVTHPDDLAQCSGAWQRSLVTGEGFEMEYRLRRASDGAYRWHLGRSLPLRDENGTIIKWFGTATDIDDQKRSQEGLRFLADAGALLSSSLEYETTVHRLAELSVPVLCDWCVVDVLDHGTLKRLAAIHADSSKTQLAYDLALRYPPRPEEEVGVPHVLRTGATQLFESITDELLAQTARRRTTFGNFAGVRFAVGSLRAVDNQWANYWRPDIGFIRIIAPVQSERCRFGRRISASGCRSDSQRAPLPRSA